MASLVLSQSGITWALGIIVVLLLAIFGYLLNQTWSLNKRDRGFNDKLGKLAETVAGIVESRKVTAEAHGKVLEVLPEMQRQVDRLVYRQELADQHAADGLHSPTHEERDHLVEKLLKGDLTREEAERVLCLLRDARRTETRPDKRFYAMLLLPRAEMELLRLSEQAQAAANDDQKEGRCQTTC